MTLREAEVREAIFSGDSIPEVLEFSANLVESLKDVCFNGKTLRELVDVVGLPLWRSICVDLALYRIPQAILDPRTLTSSYARARRHVARMCSRIDRRRTNKKDVEDWPAGRKVVFISPSAYMERDILQPVMRALMTNHGTAVISMRKAPVSQMPGVVYDDPRLHWNAEVASQFRLGMKELQKSAHTILEHLEDLPHLHGLEKHAVPGAIRAIFEMLLWIQLPVLLRHAVLARRILDRNPSLVVSPDIADPITRAWVILAHERGLPTLEIQFGSCGPSSTEWRFLVADRVAVWGNEARRVLISHGVDRGRIEVTGSPRHDEMVCADELREEGVRHELGIERSRRSVLYASSICQSEYGIARDRAALEKTNIAMLELASAARNWTLVVKPHPLDRDFHRQARTHGYHNVVWADKSHDIRKLISACDVFVSLGSTATMDAIIAGKPCICASFDGWSWSDQFIRSGAVLRAHDARSLGAQIEAAVNRAPQVLAELETAREVFVADCAFQADGFSSERIARLAVKLAAS